MEFAVDIQPFKPFRIISQAHAKAGNCVGIQEKRHSCVSRTRILIYSAILMHESRKDVHSLVNAAKREAPLKLSGRGLGVSLVEMLLPNCDPQEKSSMRETTLGARRTVAPCSSIIVSAAIPLNLLTEASSVAVSQKRHRSIRDWHRLAPVSRSRPISIAACKRTFEA